MAKIIYTYTDEAPMLATYSLLPVFQRFARPMGITIEKKDISVAGRILSYFPDYLTPEQVGTLPCSLKLGSSFSLKNSMS